MDLHIMEDKKKSSERNSCQLRWEQFYFAPIHIWNNLQVVMMGGFPPFPPSCCQERDSTYNNNLFYVGFAGIAVKVLLSSGGKKYWTLHELSSSTWVSPMLIGIFNRLRKKRKERSYSVETIRICQFDPVSHELQKRERKKKISPCVGTLKILFRNVQKRLICVAGSH